MKKGCICEGIIEKVEFPNRGKVTVEGETVIVKNGIPGQKVRFVINKKRGKRLEGRLLEVLEKSPLEKRGPVCSIFPDCGGCMYQTMPYEEQLKMKQAQVKEILDRAVLGEYEYESIHGARRNFTIETRWSFLLGMLRRTVL